MSAVPAAAIRSTAIGATHALHIHQRRLSSCAEQVFGP